MLVVQVVGSVCVYAVLCPFDALLGEAMMICVLAPTAVAATVVTGMLGGSVPCLAAYTLASNLCVAIVSPVIFSLVGTQGEMSFGASLWYVCRQVGPLLLLPLAGAWILEYFIPSAHKVLKSHQSISFYLWSFSLTIVVGKTVSFIMQQDSKNYGEEFLPRCYCVSDNLRSGVGSVADMVRPLQEAKDWDRKTRFWLYGWRKCIFRLFLR